MCTLTMILKPGRALINNPTIDLIGIFRIELSLRTRLERGNFSHSKIFENIFPASWRASIASCGVSLLFVPELEKKRDPGNEVVGLDPVQLAENMNRRIFAEVIVYIFPH